MEAIRSHPLTAELVDFCRQNKALVTALSLPPLAVAAYCLWSRYRNLPPGPLGWPLVGSALSIDLANMHVDLAKMGEKYGDVFSITMGRRTWVMLNSYEAAKEVHLSSGAMFASRADNDFMFAQVNLQSDVFQPKYDEKLKAVKTFSMQALRRSGFGSKASEAKLLEEIDQLLNYLVKTAGEPVDLTKASSCLCAAVLSSTILGQQYSWDDPQIEKLISGLDETMEGMMVAFMYDMSHQYLPDTLKKIFDSKTINHVKQTPNKLRELMAEHLQTHRDNFDENNLSDYMYMVLNERKDDPEYSDIKIIDSIISFMPDAVNTMSQFIVMMMWFLAHFPEEQEKMFDQIQQICGTNRKPTLDDKTNLPFVDAFIMEVFRVRPPLNLSLPAVALQNTKLRGYDIPTSAYVHVNTYALHMNPNTFPEPEQFRPTRHVTPEGKYSKHEHVNAFGIGRRACMGQQMARIELFLVLANVVQKFKICFPESDKKDFPNRHYMDKAEYSPFVAPFKVCAIARD